MVPVAILPAAGLLLGVGAGAQNMYKQINDVDAVPDGIFKLITDTMVGAGDIVFGNLALLFAIGVAIGLTADAGVAALAGTVGFLVFNKSISVFMSIQNVNEITCAPEGTTGVVPDTCPPADAIVTSVVAVDVGPELLQHPAIPGVRQHPGHPEPADRCLRRHHHRRPGRVVLQQVVPHRTARRTSGSSPASASSRSRPRPSPSSAGCSRASSGRPSVRGSTGFADAIKSLGAIGVFIFGLVERSLIPFGLHHIWYSPFWFQFGEYTNLDGEIITGDQRMWFAQLADDTPFVDNAVMRPVATWPASTPFMMFGLPAAAYAMYRQAKSSQQKIAAGILSSAALTSFLTGITEPIEFTFLFIAPWLFGIHAVFAGLSFMIMYITGTRSA